MSKWITMRGSTIAATPTLPGVWRRKEGGHFVRGRAKDPRTGKLKEIWKALPEMDQAGAYKFLHDELDRIREGVVVTAQKKVPFSSYAVSLLKRKIEWGDIRSVAGIEKWENVLSHFVQSPMGELYIDQIRVADVLAWKANMSAKINSGTYAPTTGNTHLAVLKVVLGHAKLEFGLHENPAKEVPGFDTSRHRPYTEEQPNSLSPEELREFLACMRTHFPQHYAMTYFGFATGLRPSSARPLRRKGEVVDVLWDKNVILIRQSNSRGDAVMASTKTALDQRLTVPDELMAVLRWHADTQLAHGPQIESDLLFPSETGGFRSRSCLDNPFKDVALAIGLKKRITPRAMRRTFQDLARVAGVPDLVTRSISGHATEEMQHHYSTVSSREQEAGLAKVLRLMDFRKASSTAPSGEVGGEGPLVSGEEKREAGGS